MLYACQDLCTTYSVARTAHTSSVNSGAHADYVVCPSHMRCARRECGIHAWERRNLRPFLFNGSKNPYHFL